jgi:hypothetical protein
VGQINKEDIISFEMVTTFYYKNCEVTLRKYNNITIIKMVGLSDMGNLLIDSETFIKELEIGLIIKYIKNEIRNIEKVYKNVVNKEYGNSNNFSLRKT